MSKSYDNSERGARATEQSDHKQAEKFSYRPPTGKAARRLDLLWVKHNRPAERSEETDSLTPRNQPETVWEVLCQAKGAPVPQFNLQHPQGVGIGRGWIALLNARLHELRWRFGYRIESRVERLGPDVKSWYWIAVGSDGFPRKDHPLSWQDEPAKEQPPQAAPAVEQPKPPQADGQQSALFDVEPKHRSAIGL